MFDFDGTSSSSYSATSADTSITYSSADTSSTAGDTIRLVRPSGIVYSGHPWYAPAGFDRNRMSYARKIRKQPQRTVKSLIKLFSERMK